MHGNNNLCKDVNTMKTLSIIICATGFEIAKR